MNNQNNSNSTNNTNETNSTNLVNGDSNLGISLNDALILIVVFLLGFGAIIFLFNIFKNKN
ncbi:MAG: hypothetical protein ISP01_04095 [Methanobrevibacter arboriphilus]|uniref:Uncharacterized protein n=1 Tax=Methanobrevibacter arboriphilus TaxID=39441 RepID=A0A843AF79_METAZ|nr:hypothetical protein [Methanobrevibacter arboriphilus]MBF4468563.1 hypothetical protein [Methanobrevibacter arboriphilus]